MIKISQIMRSALIVSAFFLSHLSLAQNIIELLPGSDRLEYDKKSGAHRLYGNVNFKYQSNVMYCDSAFYYQRTEEVFAYGNVHINKRDTLNLFCDSLYYNGRKRKAKLWGHVRVRDNEYKLSTDTLEYDSKSGQASYRYGGKVESIVSREVLTSRVGYFHPETKNFYFANKVNYKGTDLTMTTDTLRYLYSKSTAYFYGPTDIHTSDADMKCSSGWYNTETQEGSLYENARIEREKLLITGDTLHYRPQLREYLGVGNVYYHDSLEEMYYTGGYAYHSDSLNYTLLTRNAIASKIEKGDTIHIHADTILNTRIDSVEILQGWRTAKIYSSGFQGFADSIVYDQRTDKAEMYVKPILWSDNAELKGTFIELFLEDSIVHKARVESEGSIIMPVEEGEYYNQLSGNEIIALFYNNELRRADVFGNATTIAFPEEEELNEDSVLIIKRIGMNRLYASDLRVDIDSSEIIGVSYLDKPDGIFYPMDQIKKEEMFIPGFDDKSFLRPKNREDLLNDYKSSLTPLR